MKISVKAIVQKKKESIALHCVADADADAVCYLIRVYRYRIVRGRYFTAIYAGIRYFEPGEKQNVYILNPRSIPSGAAFSLSLSFFSFPQIFVAI